MTVPSLHATAVAIDGKALLICGPSRAGKSRLAVALIARATPAQPIVLIGDDRILLSDKSGSLLARPHPRIAGFVERRGLGIVAMDWVTEAPVGGLVELFARRDAAPSRAGRGPDGPSRVRYGECLRLVPHLGLAADEGDPDRVLAWWDARDAAAASHPPQKRPGRDRTCAKD